MNLHDAVAHVVVSCYWYWIAISWAEVIWDIRHRVPLDQQETPPWSFF